MKTHTHRAVHTQQTLTEMLPASVAQRKPDTGERMARLQKGGRCCLRAPSQRERPSRSPFLAWKHFPHPSLAGTTLWLFSSSTQVLIGVSFSKTKLVLRLSPFQQIGLNLDEFNSSRRQKVLLDFISCFRKRGYVLSHRWKHPAQMLPAVIAGVSPASAFSLPQSLNPTHPSSSSSPPFTFHSSHSQLVHEHNSHSPLPFPTP